MPSPTLLQAKFAESLLESRTVLAGRWLNRIAARISLPPRGVFPTDELLDHIPLLLQGIADHIRDGSDIIPADSAVLHHARELGALRHSQGFSEYEILKEFELLGAMLFDFLRNVVRESAAAGEIPDAVECSARLFHAVSLVQQATTTRFLELARDRVSEREERLRTFQRALTHEMRNRVGAMLGAAQLLQTLEMDTEERTKVAGVVARNADSMRLVLENLLELTRLDVDARQQRHVPLPSAVFEATRQLRDMAMSRSVEIQVSPTLPSVEVNAAVVELALMNLLSNAIKYADQGKTHRWVRVSGEVTDTLIGEAASVTISVEDNGIGIPSDELERVFERFYRAHSASVPSVEGSGLGLNLVRETLETIGGRAWAENTGEGTRFVLSIPARRASDISAATQAYAKS
jgi:signal transduction histidine kinase